MTRILHKHMHTPFISHSSTHDTRAGLPPLFSWAGCACHRCFPSPSLFHMLTWHLPSHNTPHITSQMQDPFSFLGGLCAALAVAHSPSLGHSYMSQCDSVSHTHYSTCHTRRTPPPSWAACARGCCNSTPLLSRCAAGCRGR